jgi:hypothetical protein
MRIPPQHRPALHALQLLPGPSDAPRYSRDGSGDLADHVWEIEELVALLEADEAKAIENGAMKR